MKQRLIALVFALVVAGSVTAAAQCSTCYVASTVDSASTSYLAGWGFECNSGALISHFDAYYYAANGSWSGCPTPTS